MKTRREWGKIKEVFELTNGELIAKVQVDAYNSAIRDVMQKAQLSEISRDGVKQIGLKYETYSSISGMKTISIDKASILALLKQE